MRQEPSAQADITFSLPRIHSPRLDAGPSVMRPSHAASGAGPAARDTVPRIPVEPVEPVDREVKIPIWKRPFGKIEF